MLIYLFTDVKEIITVNSIEKMKRDPNKIETKNILEKSINSGIMRFPS